MSLFIKPFWIEAKNRLIINTALALVVHQFYFDEYLM